MKKEDKQRSVRNQGTKKEFKRNIKSELKFSSKSRLDFLHGFSQRKKERQTKGHLKAKRKLMEEKQKDRQTIRSHINKEFTRAQESALINMGRHTSESVCEKPTVLEDRVVYYEKDDAFNIDGFGDVHVHVSSLESPEFSKLNSAQSTITPV